VVLPGRTLGCASAYTAVIRARGGRRTIGVIDNVTGIEWDRRIDEPSQATVTVATSGLGSACCGMLSKVRAWGHELALFRHAGPRPELVWEGVLMNPEESWRAGQVKLTAYDMAEWLKVRVNHTPWRFPAPGIDACKLVGYMICDAFAPDDPGVTKHMVVTPYRAGTSALLTRDDDAETVVAWKAISEICKTLVDITTVGRRIVVMPQGQPPWNLKIILRPDDFVGDVTIGQDGSEFFNRCLVIGKGVRRTVKRQAHGQTRADDLWRPQGSTEDDDTFHGLVERLLSLQDVTSDTEAYASARGALNAATMPAYVRVTDNGQLSPSAPVAMADLVPGTPVDLALPPEFCLNLPWRGLLQLSRVDVKWTPDGEAVGASIGAVAPAVPAVADA